MALLWGDLSHLTRLGNRRMLESLLEDYCDDEKPAIRCYGLILVDIDFFGLYNNHYGHLQGDIALMRVGSVLERHANGEQEVFCRIGGEEFALLVVAGEAPNVAELSESIRFSIEQENILHEQSDIHRALTVSVGYSVMEVNQRDFNFDALFNAADQSLYQAKRSGRNQVVGSVSLLESTP